MHPEMNTSKDVVVRIFRYEPGVDAEPRYETISCPRTPHMRVLDALDYAYEELDVPLAYRWFCGTKKCGECAITVNGKPTLACWEPAFDEMTCEPLTNFPIIRDLAVDREEYEKLVLRLQPEITRSIRPVFPERLRHSQMQPIQRLLKCLECNICSAAVPVKGLSASGIDWDGYSGPAVLVRFARFVLDPRDETPRLQMAEESGLFEFPLLPVLRDVCPQEIDILSDALVPARKHLRGREVSVATAGSSDVGEVRFVTSRTWTAFVRMTDAVVVSLVARGALVPTRIAGIRHAFRFEPGDPP